MCSKQVNQSFPRKNEWVGGKTKDLSFRKKETVRSHIVILNLNIRKPLDDFFTVLAVSCTLIKL